MLLYLKLKEWVKYLLSKVRWLKAYLTLILEYLEVSQIQPSQLHQQHLLILLKSDSYTIILETISILDLFTQQVQASQVTTLVHTLVISLVSTLVLTLADLRVSTLVLTPVHSLVSMWVTTAVTSLENTVAHSHATSQVNTLEHLLVQRPLHISLILVYAILEIQFLVTIPTLKH